jgi:DNA-binding helix-turn-helix protein
MRENLKRARKEKDLTQQEVADRLGIDIRYYKSLESGERLGSIQLWDKLEDLFRVHQRKLREISENHPSQEDSQ